MSTTQNTIDVIVKKTTTTNRSHPRDITIDAESIEHASFDDDNRKLVDPKSFHEDGEYRGESEGLDHETCKVSLANNVVHSRRKDLHDV
jgi:hypothetical protein